MKIEVGAEYTKEFSFSQQEVIDFSKVTGDTNPIHLDADFAANTVFKQPIVHGFLGGSVFSKIIGTEFPGEGSIYLKQSMEFLRPMFVGRLYIASVKFLDIDPKTSRATLETVVTDSETKKKIIAGEALVMNKEKF